MSCGVDWRLGSGVAIAPIQPLAWEPPYAAGSALKTHKKPQNQTKQPPTHTTVSRSSCRGSVVMSPTSIHEDSDSIPGLTQ